MSLEIPPIARQREKIDGSIMADPQKLRVLFLTQGFDPEPGAIRGLPLAKWFLGRGHEVEVITGVPNYPGGKVYDGYKIRFLQREVMDGVPVIRVPLYPSHDSSTIRRISTYVSFALSAATIGAFAAKRADVCFVVSPPPTLGLPAFVLKYLRRIPFVYHVSDMWPDSAVESGMLGDGRLKRVSEKVLHWWCNLIYRKSAAVTVLADTPLEVLADRGVTREKLTVVYNWADESLFYPMQKDADLARELDISTHRFNLIYAGNFGIFQNLEVAIRAAHKIRDEAPNLRLILLGTGTEEAKLKALVKDLGASNVSFRDRRPYSEMPAVSALADAMLVHLSDIPLLRLTVPSKTQVALAMGIPMLMAAVSDTARMATDGQAGVVCRPDDPDAMAEAMLELYGASDEELKSFGENGLHYYHNKISLESGGMKMLRIFQDVVDG